MIDEHHEVDFIHAYLKLGHGRIAELIAEQGKDEVQAMITNLKNHL